MSKPAGTAYCHLGPLQKQGAPTWMVPRPPESPRSKRQPLAEKQTPDDFHGCSGSGVASSCTRLHFLMLLLSTCEVQVTPPPSREQTENHVQGFPPLFFSNAEIY